MKLSSIKNRANEILLTNKSEYIRILTIILLVGLIPSLFSGNSNFLAILVYYAMIIIFLPFHHGYIVSSLKMVRNQSQALSDDDAFVGFKRFKELFATYFLSNVIVWAISAAAGMILVLLLSFTIVNAARYIMDAAVNQSNAAALALAAIQHTPSLIIFIGLFLVLVAIAIVIVSSYLFAVPYLLEQYHMSATQSLKESIQFMKGHVWELIKLQLSFLGWMILIIVIQSILINLLAFIPVIGSLIASILGGLAAIYTYLPRYHLSQAIFFEEIAYYRYENNTYQSNTGENTNV